MFIEALFATAKTWKNNLSIDRRMDKENVIHTHSHTQTQTHTHYNGTLFSYEKGNSVIFDKCPTL